MQGSVVTCLRCTSPEGAEASLVVLPMDAGAVVRGVVPERGMGNQFGVLRQEHDWAHCRGASADAAGPLTNGSVRTAWLSACGPPRLRTSGAEQRPHGVRWRRALRAGMPSMRLVDPAEAIC